MLRTAYEKAKQYAKENPRNVAIAIAVAVLVIVALALKG